MAYISVVSTFLLLTLNIFQIEAFNPKQNPSNAWVYFGRGLNQREIIDLARPTAEEEVAHLNSSASTSAKITTEKLLETTLESRVTNNSTSTTTVIPTTAAPVATKEIPNIRNLPETIVNETTTDNSESATTIESLKKEELVTDSPTEVVVQEKVIVPESLPKKVVIEIASTPESLPKAVVVVEASTSESPLRAKIVVIPKEKIPTIDSSEVSENVTDSVLTSTKESESLEVATTNSPSKTSSSPTKTSESNKIPIAKKSSKEATPDSSEEEKEKSEAVASIPSLRLVLRRIFKGE